MGWVHCHKRHGAYFALAALVLQIAVSFGHVDLGGIVGSAHLTLSRTASNRVANASQPRSGADPRRRRRLLPDLRLDLSGLHLVRVRAAAIAGAGWLRTDQDILSASRAASSPRCGSLSARALRRPPSLAVGADLCIAAQFLRRQWPQDRARHFTSFAIRIAATARPPVSRVVSHNIAWRSIMSVHAYRARRLSVLGGSALATLLAVGLTASAQNQPAQDQPAQSQPAQAPSPRRHPGAVAGSTDAGSADACSTGALSAATASARRRSASANHCDGTDQEAAALRSSDARRRRWCRR